MKKFVYLTTTICICLLFALAGCSPNYKFVKAANQVDLLKAVMDIGGVTESVSVKRNGSGELYVRFEGEDANVRGLVQSVNETALNGMENDGKQRYASGERVVEVKGVKKKNNAVYATIYFKNAEHLNNPNLDIMPLQYYLEHNSVDNILFSDRAGKVISAEKLDRKAMVLVINANAAQKDIKVPGSKILAASSGVLNGAYKKNSIRYVQDDCVILFAASYQTLIIIISVSVVAVLAAVFLLLVKLGVFTNLKLRSEKNKK